MTYKILRLPDVTNITGLSRSSIYQKISDGEFPKQINISAKSVGWIESEIQNWIADKIQTMGGQK
jgi:prophage regulatory protein